MSNKTITKQRTEVYWLVLCAILISITLVMKVIFYFIPIINGYGIELHLVVYIYSLIIIKNHKWKWTYWFITPWVLLIIPPTFINFWDLLLEYILALYIFVPFIFWEKIIPKKNDKKALVIQILIFSVLIITLIFLKLFIHTIAGVLWWMPNNWYGSFIFNLPIYGVTLAFVLPISILVYQPMQKLIISRI